MNKTLVHNEAEYIAIFSKMDLGAMEQLLGIEYAYEDGYFPGDDRANEMLDASETIYRKVEGWDNFPESYPCLVLHWIEDTFDRMGDVKIRLVEFVYPHDLLEVAK